MNKFNIISFDFEKKTITLDAEEYFDKGGYIGFGDKFKFSIINKNINLSIPKFIADILNKIEIFDYSEFDMQDILKYFDNYEINKKISEYYGLDENMDYDEALKVTIKFSKLLMCYLNPLTREFVEVVE